MKNTINNYEAQYKRLLLEAINTGVYRDDRTGVGCYSIFNASLKVNITNNFPLITGRKMFEKTFKTEFDWFINGETNTKRFRDAGVKIWDAWADEDGNLGPVYGHQMRNFNSQGIDQLEAVIDSLKTNKDSRRHIISLWNPAQLDEMKLPPCYLYFQFFEVAGHLNMFVVQRSGDLFLGVPYDMALFSQILLYISERTGLIANDVHVQIVDAHVYMNQEEAINEYLAQPTHWLPKYEYKDGILTIKDYNHGPIITATVAV